jgi:hypothetical protein
MFVPIVVILYKALITVKSLQVTTASNRSHEHTSLQAEINHKTNTYNNRSEIGVCAVVEIPLPFSRKRLRTRGSEACATFGVLARHWERMSERRAGAQNVLVLLHYVVHDGDE